MVVSNSRKEQIMTSIVITPFDPDHAEELKAFIENEIDNADFDGEDMPSSVCIEDVAALKRQRDSFKAALDTLMRVTLDAMLADGYELSEQEKAAREQALAAFAAAEMENR
jgi:hypothetical protein